MRFLAFVLLLLLVACKPATSPKPTSEAIFEMAAPSVVAILNDDRSDREQEIQEMLKARADDKHTPKRVIDVSLRKDPTPHGTGFMVTTPKGPRVITAAHVVLRPDRLKLTTRRGETVEAELEEIDEVRDIAVLRPKSPLNDVPPLPLGTKQPVVGQSVWALGHTGHGFWALSWGMSAGIASGIVEMFGAKLLLFDAAVYPGFSGGPVVTVEEDGKPHVVGVNHAILFTGGGLFPIGPISSASSLDEISAVIAGRRPEIEAVLGKYAREQRTRKYADIFVTDRLSVSRDAQDNQVAMILGHTTHIDASDTEDVRIPAVAMIFNLGKGSHDVTFEIHDPEDKVLTSETVTIRVKSDKDRVSFASTAMRFRPKAAGNYSVVAKHDGVLGHTHVTVARDDDDEEETHSHDDDDETGDPDVDIVVAQGGREDPLALFGIRSAWAEKSYPRRVGYTWFARGSRGWTGTFVSITAFVLDEGGKIVGRSDGCLTAELRPENTWSCVNSGGMSPPPMPTKEGHYDIVFAINKRPVAWWPMEATLKQQHAPGSDLSQYVRELQRKVVKRRKHLQEAPAPAPSPR
jgi:S1-C subfamily serine protease